MKSVAVIIPVYNEERFLAKTVESFIQQSYRPNEIIIINDCSNDRTESITRQLTYKFPTVKYISNRKNLGAAETRNIGAAHAMSEIVCFAEGDGVYAKNYLKKCVKFLLTDNKVISGGGLRRPLESNSSWGAFWDSLFEGRWSRLNTNKTSPIGGWCFPRKEFLESGGYRVDLRQGEDTEFVQRLVTEGWRNKWVARTFFYHNEPSSSRNVYRRFFLAGRERSYDQIGLGMIFISVLSILTIIPVVFMLVAPVITLARYDGRVGWNRHFKKWKRGRIPLRFLFIFPYQYLFVKNSIALGMLARATCEVFRPKRS
jgi:glycosyltransferase involved in cell wall biosynthesis